jgi:hypothetical protein
MRPYILSMVVFFSTALVAFASSVAIASHGYSHDTWLGFCATEALAISVFVLSGMSLIAGVGVCEELRQHCDC